MTGIAPALALAVMLSAHAQGAPVQMSLRATFQLQCGWPGPEVSVTFPARDRLPVRLGATGIFVDGKAPAAFSRIGRTVTFAIARPAGAMCDAIGPGVVRIVFTRVSRLRNPPVAGRYPISVRHGRETASGAFSIR